METRNDAVKALVYNVQEDKRDFGDVDEERDNKEEDLLAALMEEMGGFDDMWAQIKISYLHARLFLFKLLKGKQDYTLNQLYIYISLSVSCQSVRKIW